MENQPFDNIINFILFAFYAAVNRLVSVFNFAVDQKASYLGILISAAMLADSLLAS